jgi:NAD(P)-dependent dehydrogenase (short-subunit alcohol dehydrogenase family)
LTPKQKVTSSTKPGAAIIVGCSSDIGMALAERWLNAGWRLAGTFRQPSTKTDALLLAGAQLTELDLASPLSVTEAAKQLQVMMPTWDALVLCPATMEPIAPFAECEFDAWAIGLEVNLIQQLRLLHSLLPFRQTSGEHQPTVLMFAGGGTNSAPDRFSSYTLSKIAAIKMCELLDREIPDTKFSILGPGWVRTKIHDETLRAGTQAGSAFEQTRQRLDGNDFTPMSDILDCCDWLLAAPRAAVGGRNFSVAHDNWGSDELIRRLVSDQDCYKLRRHENSGPTEGNMKRADET